MIQLVGVNRSPFTRRVAITLQVYGTSCERHSLSGFGCRADRREDNLSGSLGHADEPAICSTDP
ncbi:hypothetical protein LJ725_02145 [Reyranella aquatilis]|uniref:GST N-terminal domain-containing protein n=1 Tax=Reyranella aquatilis TaxID=2035356 RepID=A0ABS8KNT5_9HYPH|nr:hypothetical protein [Reyranella aquatilis]